MVGRPMLTELLASHDIILVQEHWLRSCGLMNVNKLSDEFEFLCSSAMVNCDSNEVGFGRPVGGLGFCLRKTISSKVTYFGVDSNCRCANVSFVVSNMRLFLFNVYLPCLGHICAEEYKLASLESTSFIENTVETYTENGRENSIVVSGDFNISTAQINVDRRVQVLRHCLQELNVVCVDGKRN